MNDNLKTLKEKINQELLTDKIREKIDGGNTIKGIIFKKNQKDFILIKQEDQHKSKKSLLQYSSATDYIYHTNLSCDYILIHSRKNKITIIFFEIKNSDTDIEKARCQMLYSKIWLRYLFDCYQVSHDIKNIEPFEQALTKSKYFMITLKANATKTRPPIGKTQQDKKQYKDMIIKYCKSTKNYILLDVYELIYSD